MPSDQIAYNNIGILVQNVVRFISPYYILWSKAAPRMIFTTECSICSFLTRFESLYTNMRTATDMYLIRPSDGAVSRYILRLEIYGSASLFPNNFLKFFQKYSVSLKEILRILPNFFQKCRQSRKVRYHDAPYNSGEPLIPPSLQWLRLANDLNWRRYHKKRILIYHKIVKAEIFSYFRLEPHKVNFEAWCVRPLLNQIIFSWHVSPPPPPGSQQKFIFINRIHHFGDFSRSCGIFSP